jgi:hypothetical protein
VLEGFCFSPELWGRGGFQSLEQQLANVGVQSASVRFVTGNFSELGCHTGACSAHFLLGDLEQRSLGLGVLQRGADGFQGKLVTLGAMSQLPLALFILAHNNHSG